jgi:FkbM family methyltransferase
MKGFVSAFAPLRWLFLLRKVFLTRSRRSYWSQYGEDIVLDRVLNLKRPGFFVDVGCYHPTKYNNTYKLYRRGWRGINIDLDAVKIAAFNLRRPGDLNILACASDKEGTVPVCSTGFYTVTETIDPATINKHRERGQVMTFRKMQTRTLTDILDGTKFHGRKIDVLSVDVEGHELNVLRSLDFDRYRPKVIIVELHARSLEELTASELYDFLRARDYSLFNWTGPSLLFIHPRER